MKLYPNKPLKKNDDNPRKLAQTNLNDSTVLLDMYMYLIPEENFSLNFY